MVQVVLIHLKLINIARDLLIHLSYVQTVLMGQISQGENFKVLICLALGMIFPQRAFHVAVM